MSRSHPSSRDHTDAEVGQAIRAPHSTGHSPGDSSARDWGMRLAAHRPAMRWQARYGAAAALVAVAVVLTCVLRPLREIHSFGPISVAVILAIFYTGVGPGLLAIAVSILGWCLLVAPPALSLRVHSGDDMIRLFQFVAGMLLIAWLYGARARAEAAFRESQQRLVLALDTVQMGAWEYTLSSGIFWLSPRMRAVLGVADPADPADSVLTHGSFLACVYPEDRPRVVRAMTCTLEDGAEYVVEYRVVHPDGDVRWVRMRGRTYLNRGGEVERMAGVAVDITLQGRAGTPSDDEALVSPRRGEAGHAAANGHVRAVATMRQV